ncbi:uncharacterized protein [Montipora capricornis]|uniref:uncharacterized protein n=1 Tax=Montipora capricornis TaxID=246305 RepID=UPI0035F18613
MVDLLSDNSKFKKLESDLTLRREGQLQRFLRKLKKNGLLDCNIYREIYPTGSQPARLYGLPKLHKVKDPKTITPPFRPIVSSIGTYNYNLAKYLCSLLKPHISSEFCATDTFSFVQEIQQFDFSDKFLVSYDVTSLFTNIPLSETIDLAVNAIIDGNMNPDLKLSKVHLKQLFNFATSHTHFLFNGCFYDQIDGVAMGSPLAPVLANFFMGHYERLWLEKYTGTQDLIGQIFSGKLKEKMTLDSSLTGEVTLEQVSDIPGNDADGESPVYSIGLTETLNDITLRDLLSKKLLKTRSAIPFNEWNDEWKKKYPVRKAEFNNFLFLMMCRIVHDDLSTYQWDMTDDLLKDLGGKDRKDSSITFIYIKDRDLSVAKPPLPDKVEQRDILQRLGSRQCKKTTADCVVIDDDQDKDLLYSLKKIKKRKVIEVQTGDLVGQYLGSTEEKTSATIKEAKGGVVFVDEAYRLTPRSTSVDYGRIAINQLMAVMEKGDQVMIFQV